MRAEVALRLCDERFVAMQFIFRSQTEVPKNLMSGGTHSQTDIIFMPTLSGHDDCIACGPTRRIVA
jgi:hypothetical protein